MTTVSSIELVPVADIFCDGERIALLGFLAAYQGTTTRGAYASDLRQFTAWCTHHHLRLFRAHRVDTECFARDFAHGRARATVTRTAVHITGFYRYAEEEVSSTAPRRCMYAGPASTTSPTQPA